MLRQKKRNQEEEEEGVWNNNETDDDPPSVTDIKRRWRKRTGLVPEDSSDDGDNRDSNITASITTTGDDEPDQPSTVSHVTQPGAVAMRPGLQATHGQNRLIRDADEFNDEFDEDIIISQQQQQQQELEPRLPHATVIDESEQEAEYIDRFLSTVVSAELVQNVTIPTRRRLCRIFVAASTFLFALSMSLAVSLTRKASVGDQLAAANPTPTKEIFGGGGGGDENLPFDTSQSTRNDECDAASGPIPAETTGTLAGAKNIDWDCANFDTRCCWSKGTLEYTYGELVGRWYRHTGRGLGVTAWLTTSNSEHILDMVVYGGTCEKLTCWDFFRGDRDYFQWDGNVGTEFFILVYGNSSIDNELRNFTIHLQESDSCPYARSIYKTLGVEKSVSVQGSLAAAGTSSSFPGCDGSIAPGEFFRLEITEYNETDNKQQWISAKTCDEEDGNKHSISDTKLSVFAGSSCANLTCVAFNDNYCELQSAVTWLREPGVVYYIFVQGSRNWSGLFTLKIQESARNNLCPDAVAIKSNPFRVTARVDLATHVEPALPSGMPKEWTKVDMSPRFNPRRGSVWYTLVGTGKIWKVNIPVAMSSLKVLVFLGQCDWLLHNDSFTGSYWDDSLQYNQSLSGLYVDESKPEVSITIPTSSETSYSIFLSFDKDSISQTVVPLLFEEIETVAENDLCSGAISPVQLGESMQITPHGYNATSDPESEICFLKKPANRGIWFFLNGNTDGGWRIRVSGNYSSRDRLVLTVFSGDNCSDLQCIATSDKVNEGNFRPLNGNDKYWILVSDHTTQGQSYNLTFEEVGIATNDLCGGAIGPLPLNGSTVMGSHALASLNRNIFGSLSDLGDCAGFVKSVGVWYFVEGNGEEITAEVTAANGTFTNELAIFSGSCDALRCEVVIPGSGSWMSKSGVTYFMMVVDSRGMLEPFELRLSIGPPPTRTPGPV